MEEELAEGPDLISSELRNWVVNIGRELDQRQPRQARNKDGTTASTIFRVPSHLLKVNRENYTPKFFSFGLYDLHERKISRLDDHRYELARIFKDIVGSRRWSRVCGKLVGTSVMTMVGYYEDLEVLPEKDMETVTNLLCLDAVFVVCFIQGRHQAICKTCREQYPIINEVIQREPLWSRRSLVLYDIFLFQNQIPLELIRNVVGLMSSAEKSRLRRILSTKSDEGVDPLHKIAMDAVEMVYSNLPGFLVLRETIQKISFGECKHLLHCLYDVICYNPDKSQAEPPRQVAQNGKTDSTVTILSTEPPPDSSPLPSETPNLCTESQGRKELRSQSSLSRSSVVPAAQEIVEDAPPQSSGNVSFKNQAERVHFLFRGEDMARLFSPENRLVGDSKKKIEERESSHSSLERIPVSQQSDVVMGTPSTTQAATTQQGSPLPSSVNATQQIGNSVSSTSFSDRALNLGKESPASKVEIQGTQAGTLPRKTQAVEGFRVTTPDGHSSRREFFGTQGKEKIVAHRLPEPLRPPPGSNVSTLRPWIASSPRVFGDGSAWSLDSEPSSPRSQMSSRPASDRKSNLVVHEIGQSNLQTTIIPEPVEKPPPPPPSTTREERTSPSSSWGCNRYCTEAGGAEETTENRRSVSEWFPALKCGGDPSPPRRSWSDWTPGFNCKDDDSNARPKRRSSLRAVLFRCLLCSSSQGRSTVNGVRIDHIPALTELKKVGIQVAVGRKTRYISEVTFKRSRSGFQGTLYLPALDVLEETEGLLRNLLAYEHVVEKRDDLLSYIHLMANLINTEEDVELLIQRGVIRANSLGSNKAVADMWRTLPTGYVLTLSPQYQDLYGNISEHCSRISNVRFEEFRKFYLARPWLVGLVIFLVIVVILTLMATVVATVYTVVTYYHKHS
ncbi:unnamed protein product [Calypogeia fissa]